MPGRSKRSSGSRRIPVASQAARAAAVQALGSIGDSRAIPVLEEQLRMPGWAVRAAAVRALGELGDPGIAVLRGAANSQDAQVRMLAEAALQP